MLARGLPAVGLRARAPPPLAPCPPAPCTSHPASRSLAEARGLAALCRVLRGHRRRVPTVHAFANAVGELQTQVACPCTRAAFLPGHGRR